MHRLDVTADGGIKSTAEACVVATAEQAFPRLDIRMTAPETIRVGEEGIITLEAKNNGTVPLRNLRISNRYSSSFFPREASKGFQLSRDGEVFWELPELLPGDSISYEVKALARRADPSAICVGTVNAIPPSPNKNKRRLASPVVKIPLLYSPTLRATQQCNSCLTRGGSQHVSSRKFKN